MSKSIPRTPACVAGVALSLLVAPALAANPGFVKPPPQTFTLDAMAPLAQAAQMPVSFRGQVAPAWTASSDSPWVVLVDGAGTGAATLHYTVDASLQASALNWATDRAHITLHSDGLADLVVMVSLARKLPDVYMVAPAIVPSGQPAHVHVYGRGLGQLASGASIQVDGAAVTAVQPISDTEVSVDLAPVATGDHAYSVTHASDIGSMQALQVAVDAAQTPTTAFVADTGMKGSLVVDERRQAVFTVDAMDGSLVRYTRSGSEWTRKASSGVTTTGSLGLSPDGSTLYAVDSDRKTLLAVDPDKLKIKSRFLLPQKKGGTLAMPMQQLRLPFTNDGRLWFAGGYWASPTAFDLSSGDFVKPVVDFLSMPVPFATPSGSRLYLVQWGISPEPPVNVYAISRGAVNPLPQQSPDISLPVSFSASGSLMLNDQLRFYDRQGNALGTLSGGNEFLPVLSPDGKRAYKVGQGSGNSGCIDHIDVFNATKATGPTVVLTPMGTIPVAHPAVSCTSNDAWTSTMAIDGLGQTLYWVGYDGFSVVAIPDNLRPAAGQP